MNRRTRLLMIFGIVLLGAFVVGAVTRFVSQYQDNRRQQAGAVPSAEVRVAPGAKIGGPFDLIDQNGKKFTDRDLRGKFALIYFGYTFCPDVCPTELLIVGQVLDRMGEAAKEIQPVFITIDPERDTIKVLRDYAANFHPRLIALGGAPEKLRAALKAFGVYAARARQEAGAPPGDYLMDHTSFIYLVGPKGRTRALFRRGSDPAAIARRVLEHMKEGR